MTAAVLEHDASPVSGPGAFVPAAVAAVRHALSVGALPVVLGLPDEIRAVRSASGAVDGSLASLDLALACRNPRRLLPALQHILDEGSFRRIVFIGLQFRADLPRAVTAEFALQCLLLRLPEFAGWNCKLTCVYDVEGLDAELVETIEASHCAGEPNVAVQQARATPLSPRPARSEELGVDRTTMGALRGFVRGRTGSAGLTGERADDLVYAVNEAVTNSICHGEGRARVSIWNEENTVVCEVRDRGWIRDPLAGLSSPGNDRVSGRGLWLVNQLCDFVQLRSSAAGTTLRMSVDR